MGASGYIQPSSCVEALISIQEKDCRSHPRIDCAIQAEVDGTTLCEILDLSVGGAFLVMPTPPASEAGILLAFTVVDKGTDGRGEVSYPLALTGQVRRCSALPTHGYGVGVEFVGIRPRSRRSSSVMCCGW